MLQYNEFLQKHYMKNERVGIMRITGGFVRNEIWKTGSLQQAAGTELDSYMSMNTLINKGKCIKRDKEHVGRLKWLYVDLDYYNSVYRAFSKQQIVGLLEQDYFGQKIPEPTYVIDSGRGLYLLWKVDEHSNAYSRWAKMQIYLTEQLQEFGADRKVASDSARVLRRIGSINSKSGTKVQIVRNQDVKYSLTNLLREYIIGDKPSEKMIQYAQHISNTLGIPMPENSRAEVKAFIQANKEPANLFYQAQKVAFRKREYKNKIAYIGTEYSLLYNRIRDLEKLLLQFRDKEGGCREHILFLYRYWQICITESIEEGLNRTLELNNRLKNPLPLKEVVCATASAEKYYLSGKILRCTNAYVIDALHITQDEMKELSVFINSSERLRRKQERNRRAYLESLKKRGKVTKEMQIIQRRRKVYKLLRKGKTAPEVCQILNISRATFYADKQQIERYLAAEIEKQQHRMEKYEVICQSMKEKCLNFSAFVLNMSFRTSCVPYLYSVPGCVTVAFRRFAWRTWGSLQLQVLSAPLYSSYFEYFNVNNIDMGHNVSYN